MEFKGKKILFANVPAEGHFNPLTGLARYLKDLGADVRWFCSDMFAGRLDKMSIQRYPLVKTMDINAGNIFKLIPEINTDDPIKRYNLYRVQYAKRSVELFEDIRDIYESFKFDLIIVDSLYPAIPFIKHKIGVPVVSVGVVPLAEDSVDTAPYSLALHPPKDEKTRALYKELYGANPDRCKEATDLFESLLSDYGIPHSRMTIENTLIKEVDLLLQIGVKEFEYQRSDMGNNIHFVGALLPYTVVRQEQKWHDEKLDRYKKIVLVTQGTVESDTTKILEPTLEAFKDTDTLVIATTGGNGTDRLREIYAADNVIIEDFIPYADVMPHAGVYVTNGGYGGTLLSIVHELPMLAAGLHEGKNEICARIDYFNIGIDMKTEKPDSRAIYEGVQEILNNSIFQDNVSRLAGRIRGIDANEICASLIGNLLVPVHEAVTG